MKWNLAVQRTRGVTLIEALFLIGMLTVVVLVLAMVVLRQRDVARTANCQVNLMRIGFALGVYHQGDGRLPSVQLQKPEETESPQSSPLGSMLMELGLADFQTLENGKDRPKGLTPGMNAKTSRPIPGLLCPGDDSIRDHNFESPVSYRASTGDQTHGQNGVFAPGRSWTFEEVQKADGTQYTAAFSERLIGDGRSDGRLIPGAYHVASGKVTAQGCPDVDAGSAKSDAGRSWAESTWRSSLYSHSLRPNESPSCIANDQQTARMGASSAHPNQVHVLMVDGRVQTVTQTISAEIWKAMANVSSSKSE